MSSGRILLLDAQTTQALACARSLGNAGYDILCASSTRRPLATWSRHCTATHLMPEESLASFATLRSWARGRGVNVVLPLTERSCLLLNAERPAWQDAGMVVGCPAESQLGQAFDKSRTLAIAERSGVSIPRTRFPTDVTQCREIAADLGLPCVVKARFSSRWTGFRVLRDTGTSYVRTVAELERAVVEHRMGDQWPIVQQYVAGRGKGVFTVCRAGEPLAWFAHERLRDVRPTGSGSSLRRPLRLEPRLQEPAERLLAAMSWHGPAMVEFRDDGVNAPWLMEVNGRFWGSLQLAVSAGIDFPLMWIRILRGQPVTAVPTLREDVTLRWWWGDAKHLMYAMAGPPPGFPGAFPTRMQALRAVFGAQPPGTRSETWDRADPWPAVGEWVQGLGELFTQGIRISGPQSEAPRGQPPAPTQEPPSGALRAEVAT